VGSAFPRWSGFEVAPEGFLLEQVVDLRGAMGIAYERGTEFHKGAHVHDRLSVVFPRGGCVMAVALGEGADRFVLDSRVFLVLPRARSHEIEGRSSILDAVALYPSEPLLARVAGEAGIPGAALARFTRVASKGRRSPWLDELVVEYFSRRVLGRDHRAPAGEDLRLFEREILREVFRLGGLARSERRVGGPARPPAGVGGRAVAFIEANLFGPLSLGAICTHAHASPSTLLRHFKERTGLTPLQYARARRLDESRALLARGGRTITEVALLVGYESPGAFCEAFRARFGEPPSRLSTRERRASPRA
jgi:AraC-like DNA-binding protein